VTPAVRAEAQRRGVLTSYTDAESRHVEVAGTSVEAVMDLLGDHAAPRGLVTHDGRLPPDVRGTVVLQDGTELPGLPGLPGPRGWTTEPAPLPYGWHRLVQDDGTERVVVCGPRSLPEPAATWGWWCHLAALRGPGSWGHGGVRELAALLQLAREQGAGAVLTTPLHPAWPGEASPYSPLSRTESDPALINIAALPELAAALPALRARVNALRPASGERSDTGRDRHAAALDLLAPARWPVTEDRDGAAQPDRTDHADRPAHTAHAGHVDHAVWAALAEVHGPDLDRWPVQLRRPSAVAAAAADPLRVARHAWAGSRAHEQLAGCATPGVRLLHDVPVGVHPGGSDAWVFGARGLLVRDASVGAPPDRLGPAGQSWSCPPWHPGRLAAATYEPWRAAMSRALRLGGGIRVDHVLQLWRLWWVPRGLEAAQGAYVRQDWRVLLAGLVLEASRTGGIVVGEDLGTVPAEVAGELASAGVLGCDVAWFSEGVAPQRWRRAALASPTTHDLPTVAGWWTGQSTDAERAQLGDVVRSSVADVAGFAGLLPDDRGGMHAATHQLVLGSPARLVLWGLADGVGDRRRPNVPGMGPPDYPSFRLPVADPHGRTVPLPTILAHPGVRALGLMGEKSRPGGQEPVVTGAT
jgi:4-alpha-glucanotransferase